MKMIKGKLESYVTEDYIIQDGKLTYLDRENVVTLIFLQELYEKIDDIEYPILKQHLVKIVFSDEEIDLIDELVHKTLEINSLTKFTYQTNSIYKATSSTIIKVIEEDIDFQEIRS